MAPSNVVASGNTYTKQSQNVETSQITINGITLKQKLLQFVKERDGIRLPHLIKEVFCSPPASLSTVLDYATLLETVNGIDQKILTQFVVDAATFEGNMAPSKIMRFENTIRMDIQSGGNNLYEIKVVFIT